MTSSGILSIRFVSLAALLCRLSSDIFVAGPSTWIVQVSFERTWYLPESDRLQSGYCVGGRQWDLKAVFDPDLKPGSLKDFLSQNSRLRATWHHLKFWASDPEYGMIQMLFLPKIGSDDTMLVSEHPNGFVQQLEYPFPAMVFHHHCPHCPHCLMAINWGNPIFGQTGIPIMGTSSPLFMGGISIFDS